MQCPQCSGKLKTTGTKAVDHETVKRSRLCSSCGHKVTTYERYNDMALTAHEARLIKSMREMSPPQRHTLWSSIRLIKTLEK